MFGTVLISSAPSEYSTKWGREAVWDGERQVCPCHRVPGQVAVSACALSHSNTRVLSCTLLTLRVCAEVQLRVFESFFETECSVG